MQPTGVGCQASAGIRGPRGGGSCAGLRHGDRLDQVVLGCDVGVGETQRLYVVSRRLKDRAAEPVCQNVRQALLKEAKARDPR